MKRAELLELYEEAKQHVRVSCCEFHHHTALDGCIDAKSEAEKPFVTICKMAEALLNVYGEIEAFYQNSRLK